jgi:hypothetical protein
MGIDEEGEEMIRGMPSKTDKDAAREKLSRVTIDMTVEAKQRLSAFNTVHSGEVSLFGALGNANALSGIKENITKTIGEMTFEYCVNNVSRKKHHLHTS